MSFFNLIWKWRKRREAIAEEKARILKDRLAKVLDEKPITRDLPRRREEAERRYREIVHATRG